MCVSIPNDGVLARRHTHAKTTTLHPTRGQIQHDNGGSWPAPLLLCAPPHLHEKVPKDPQRPARGGDVERHEPRLAAARDAELVREVRFNDVVLRFHNVVLPVEHKGEVREVVVVAARPGETKRKRKRKRRRRKKG